MPPKKANANTKPAWYAVKIGRVPGVYRTWDECQAQVHKVPGAVFKKFDAEWEAQVFAGLRPNLVSQPEVVPLSRVGPCLYVDGSCKVGEEEAAYASVVDQDGRDVLPDHAAALLADMTLVRRPDLPVGPRLVIEARFDDVAQQQNNGAELLAAVAGLRIALSAAKPSAERDDDQSLAWPRVLSDSTLIVQHWSRKCKAPHMDPRKAAYVRELIALRAAFEARGGQLLHISGGDNLADLGFHR